MRVFEKRTTEMDGDGGCSTHSRGGDDENIMFHLNPKVLLSKQKSRFSLLTTIYCIVLALLFGCICVAKANTHRGDKVSKTVRHSHDRPLRQQRDTPHSAPWQPEEKGYCAPYNGKVCKRYISGQVWYSRGDPSGGWKNEQITTALWEELIGDLNGHCRTAAEVSNCKHCI